MSPRFGIEVEKDSFNFASAHFLIFADGKREALHGHNYQVTVAVEGDLDRAGLVLNFTALKPLVKKVCDGLDHRTLVPSKNPGLKIHFGHREVEIIYRDQRIILPRRDVVLIPIMNVTTELLAEHLAKQIWRKIHQAFPDAKLSLIEVAVEEGRGQRGFFRQNRRS